MSDGKYSGLYPGRNLPHELGFRTFHGTDCGWSSCCRNSTHFHCRACGYGTSQPANVVAHHRMCIANADIQKEYGRLTPSIESSLVQHEVLQSTQTFPYYSSTTVTSSSLGNSNSKTITTQQSAMFNFVLPAQSSQYGSLYGTQTVFPNSNLFSPSNYNNFGQLDPSWLPQSRLIPPNIHTTNTTELLGSGKTHLDPSNSPLCCGRVGNTETAAIGMCSPLTAEAYKVVSKEFQSKFDSQNCYCNSQSLMNFNGSGSSCKFSDSAPSCSVNLLLLEQNDLKQGEECINVDDLCFESTKSEIKCDDKERQSESFEMCCGIPNKSMEPFVVGDQKKDLSVSNENLDIESTSDSEGSDIIVEELESETFNCTSYVKQMLELTCLVCNKSPPIHSVNDFVKISDEMPLTTSTQVSILTKLSQVMDDDNFNKLKDCIICPRCLNLINVVDQLEIKLNSAKKELVDMYKSKDCVGDSQVIQDKSDSDENNLFCQICNKKFSSNNYLKKHKQCHTKVFSYYCEYCGKGFAVLQKLQNHLILHSNSSRFQCELCGKRFIQKHNLIDHIKKHRGEYKYKCSVCQKAFIRKSVYKTHLLVHNSESLMCQHCGKQFKNLANLSVHIKLCSGDLRFSCEKCDKKFPIKSLLKKHISIKHDSQYRFVCTICKKGFGKKSDLKTHMRSHSDSKPFKCSECNNSYKSLSNLNQHFKVHSSGDVLECNVCGKKFSRKDCLKDHLNQHTGSKPYKCTSCWKTFANRINFNSHMKRHNGTLKQTPCPICGKLFSKGLKDHMTTHSGQKPYSCKQCLSVFTVKSSLNKHVKTKHNNL